MILKFLMVSFCWWYLSFLWWVLLVILTFLMVSFSGDTYVLTTYLSRSVLSQSGIVICFFFPFHRAATCRALKLLARWILPCCSPAVSNWRVPIALSNSLRVILLNVMILWHQAMAMILLSSICCALACAHTNWRPNSVEICPHFDFGKDSLKFPSSVTHQTIHIHATRRMTPSWTARKSSINWARKAIIWCCWKTLSFLNFWLRVDLVVCSSVGQCRIAILSPDVAARCSLSSNSCSRRVMAATSAAAAFMLKLGYSSPPNSMEGLHSHLGEQPGFWEEEALLT